MDSSDRPDPGRNDPCTGIPVDPDTDTRPGRPPHLVLSHVLAVAVGGALGTAVRYAVGILQDPPPAWPWGTFAVNLAGCLALGVLLEGLARAGSDRGLRRRARLFLGTGFCGGLTTFSTYALEVDQLARHGAAGTAVAYGVVSVVLGIALAGAGLAVAAGVHRARSGR